MTSGNYPKLIIVAVILVLIASVGLVITNLGSKEINNSNNWQKYTDSEFGFSIMYPSNFKLQESPCSQLGYPAPFACLLTSDFKMITEKTAPGDGGENERIVEIKGSLIEINTSVASYSLKDIDEFCKPGGPVIVDRCRKEKLNNYEFALRELGSYKDGPTVLNAVLINNDEAYIEFTLHFSKSNKEKDVSLFNEILSTIEIK